jgi:hypothetical protein
LTNPAATSDDRFSFQIHVNSEVVFRLLTCVIALLLVGSLTVTTIVYVLEPSWMPPWHFWNFLLDLDDAHNIHGWYEASTMLLCGVVLAGIGIGYIQAHQCWSGIGWLWLAAGFLYLSLDAAAARMNLEHSLTNPSASPFVWAVPVVFALGVLPFVVSLPPDTRRDFVFAAFVMALGAVVLDLVADSLDTGEVRPFASRVASNVEEAVEMLGVAMFIRATLVYIAVCCREIVVRTPGTE